MKESKNNNTSSSKNHSQLVKEHFDLKYRDYDILITKLIPKYKEMHELVVSLIDFPTKSNVLFLDLGIGSGQTALQILQKYLYAELDGIDISKNMLDQAKLRLKKYLHRVNFYTFDFKDLEPTKRYDACYGVLSVHHLSEQQKPQLFKKIFATLKEDGVFVIADIVKFNSAELTKRKEVEWKNFLVDSLGKVKAQYWFDNYREEDIPSSVSNQIKWLKESGFTDVMCVWNYINCAVIIAKK